MKMSSERDIQGAKCPNCLRSDVYPADTQYFVCPNDNCRVYGFVKDKSVLAGDGYEQ